MNKSDSGSRTLLMSVLMSAPGPLILALGLRSGRSTTQLADFLRRSAELLAIICSYVVYKITKKDSQTGRLRSFELEKGANYFVGAVMCFSGAVMVALAFFSENEAKGNVTGGLIIAFMGMIANTLFWRKYTRLNRQSPNAVLSVQARLYRAKAVVDICVTVTLAAVALFPVAKLTMLLDRAGSVAVAVYLIACGIKTVKESGKQNKPTLT